MWLKSNDIALPKRWRAVGWYLFWLAVILFLYRSGLQMFPKKDHVFFMLGRELFDDHMAWFLKSLSYNRTRILFPGDYFAFRPVLMAILGLEDIFLRHQLLALGIIGCGLFSFTATSFFMLLRRIAGVAPALLLTLTWSANLAGSEILLWQHITPYVLAPGFLSLGILLLTDDPSNTRRQWVAGLLFLAACLTHETSVIVCILSSFILFFLGQPSERYRTSLALLLPAAFALMINAIDFFLLHPSPSLQGAADNFNWASAAFQPLISFLGATGVAVFFPWRVHLTLTPDWAHLWVFSDLPTALLSASAGIVLLLSAAVGYLLYRNIRNGEKSILEMVAPLTLLLFFSATFTVCSFRLVTRGVAYLHEATYYFSFSSFALCGLLCVLISKISDRQYRKAAMVVLTLLAVFQVSSLMPFLRSSEQDRAQVYKVFKNARIQIEENPGACFGGMDTTSLPGIFNRWTPLFQDISCSSRRNAIPYYLSVQNGTLLLSSAVFSGDSDRHVVVSSSAPGSAVKLPQFVTESQYGCSFSFSLSKTPAFTLVLTGASGNTRMVQVDHNLVATDGLEARFSALPYNSEKTDVKYRIVFTESHLVFLANDLLVSSVPHYGLTIGEKVQIILHSQNPGQMINLIDFKVAGSPGIQQLLFKPAVR